MTRRVGSGFGSIKFRVNSASLGDESVSWSGVSGTESRSDSTSRLGTHRVESCMVGFRVK